METENCEISSKLKIKTAGFLVSLSLTLNGCTVDPEQVPVGMRLIIVKNYEI